MKKFSGLIGVSTLALVIASPAMAQDAGQDGGQEIEAPVTAENNASGQAAAGDAYSSDIVVTAQRRAESLQEVPIAVSAFSAEALERQQIENSSDLQLTLPNVTFTKTNFTASSFTIRGIGDLCVGVSCDSATAIHINGSPLLSTRLFETEFFDLERIEVLRGPQGTLFGRNATSGVVNIITAKPDMGDFSAAGEAEYGNFDAIKVKAMVNVPIGDAISARVAGFYLKRDGFIENLYDNTRIDDRDMFGIRASIRIEPTDTTTVDFMASYFREDDNRSRIQKQLCQRDPTGILGCLPARLDNDTVNGNSVLTSTIPSRQLFAFQGLPVAFALADLYGPDGFRNQVNPEDLRQVRTDFTPTYVTSEQMYQARLDQKIGDDFNFQLTGLYQRALVDSQADYTLAVQDRTLLTPALTALFGAANGFIPGLPASYFSPIANAILPQGPAGPLCTSLPERSGTGAYGGNRLCSDTPQDFDRSRQTNSAWSVEGLLTSDFDGMFNFLLGGIYVDYKATENSYYVNAFGIDYLSGIIGTFSALGNRNPTTGAPEPLPPFYLGTPFFHNFTDRSTLKSYGIFGEGYFDVSDRLKLTLGLRYNNDRKYNRARSTLANSRLPVPFGATDAFDQPLAGGFDADEGLPGNQPFQERRVRFSEFTGRAVVDFKLTDDNLLYASYARGYKSGGINPPLQAVFEVPESFAPETIDSFEIGSKNVFANGALILNLTGFYYRYSDLQLARIVARTSVNDNVSANVWGVEAEAIIRPDDAWLFNLGFSYLDSKVSEDKFLANPRDPSGGRNDAVIIKDISNASNCAVVPTVAGNAAGANGFVTVINQIINQIGASRNGGVNPAPLAGPTPFPDNSGIGATGAFSLCQILAAGAAGNIAAINPAFGALQPLLSSFGVQVLGSGVPVNIRGNELPQAPNIKFSAGAQYTHEWPSGMTLVPRLDVTYTGESYASIFNGRADRLEGYVQANAQIQLSGPDERWYVRGFVQNIFDNDAITGQYVTDASSGLFTNVFTLDPRRYGVAVGFKF